MEKFNQILIDILATALATVLICFVRAGIKWLGTKVESEKIRLALQELQTVLEDGIGFVEQTFVRVAKEGGTWDKAAQEEALKLCRDYVLGNITDKTLNLLTEDKEEIVSWLTAKIESQIHYSKPPQE
jgi:hypothetical protein